MTESVISTQKSMSICDCRPSGKSPKLIKHKSTNFEISLPILECAIDLFVRLCWIRKMLCFLVHLGKKNYSFYGGSKSMQINPLFISLWIIRAFALLFGARELNKIIRKVQNANVYWAVGKRDDPAHGWQRILYGVGVNPWNRGIPLWLTSTAGVPTCAETVPP